MSTATTILNKMEPNKQPWLRHPGDLNKGTVRAKMINLETSLMTTPPYVSSPGISLRQIGLMCLIIRIKNISKEY